MLEHDPQILSNLLDQVIVIRGFFDKRVHDGVETVILLMKIMSQLVLPVNCYPEHLVDLYEGA